ncbi:MAG: IclR family transcriptional regulator [Vallitaleaceae bacterium]|nr:IclR family transcriptional regulator [Vallitaleaceae bacterium]
MSESTLQTADRALMVLEILAKEGLTATEIQKKLELNKSTVHRLMMTLLNRGFVERNERTGIYQIGLKLVEISSIRLNQIELKTEAIPYLHELANQVQMSVQLAILDEKEAVFIEKVDKYQSFHMYCQSGKRIPLYCSAVGKSLLLEKTEYEIKGLLGDEKFIKYTDHTLETVEELIVDINESKKLGYTKDQAEHEKDVYCLAMPIRDYRGEIVASASITGFTREIYTEQGQGIREALKRTCANISTRLGHQNKESFT